MSRFIRRAPLPLWLAGLAFAAALVASPVALPAGAPETTADGTEIAAADGSAAAGEKEVVKVTDDGLELDLSDYFSEWAKKEIIGIAIWQMIAAFAFILIGLVLKKTTDFVFRRKLIPLFKKSPFTFDHMILTAASKPLAWLLLLIGVSGALGVLPLPTEEPNVHRFVFGVVKVLLAADLLWFLFCMVDVAVGYLAKLAERTESKLDDQLVPLVQKALKVTLGLVIFVWVVQLLGYSASGLLAGLGIGGLAVALALQDTLANFFGSIFIFLDRPFSVGDWIKVNDVEGVVETIGFRSTRIRTWPATVVSIPNKTIAAATIDNWSKMPKRRVFQTVGVTYKTSADQMEKAVAAVREMVTADEGVDKEFIMVRFTDFGESSLNIMLYYFIKSVLWDEYLATKERINLKVMRMLKDMGLAIAFPTRTVYFDGDVARKVAGALAEGPGEKPRLSPKSASHDSDK